MEKRNPGLVTSVVALVAFAYVTSCSREPSGHSSVETVTSALTMNSFPVTVRINSVTVGQTFTAELNEFSLDRFSSEFFQCGPQATLSNLFFCNKGQVYNIPNDLPPSDLRSTFGETVTVFIAPGQTTATVPITISQMPTNTFGQGAITLRVSVDLTTGASTATALGAPPIKQLTNTCVTNGLDWKFCWEVQLPCQPGNSIACTTQSPTPGCPPVNGHSVCNGLVPGPCVPDPAPGGATCGVTTEPWDLTPNLPPGQPSVNDDNGLLWNPRWGWQVGGTQPLAFFVLLTTQPTTHQSAFLCDAQQLANADFGAGHTNWTDATYNGPLRWDSHSAPGADDDYNISIITPLAVGTSFPAGITADNDQHTFIQTEFDSDETIDHFNAIDWWQRFHGAVDTGNDAVPAAMIDGHDAVITGLVGLDQSHDAKSELHPVHVFAVRQTARPAPSDDAWSIFFRNWGDEGFCGPDQEYLNLTTLTLRLPRPTPAQGVPAGATFSFGPSTHFVANFTPPAGSSVAFSTAADNGDTLVTVTLQQPTAHSFIVGEAHLVWSPTGPISAPPPPPIPSLQAGQDAGPEESWREMLAGMTAIQRNTFDAMFAGLSPPEAPLIVALAARKSATPPRPVAVPSTFTGPLSTRTAARTQARLMAACVATRGSTGEFAPLCNRPDLGTGRCLYASGTLSVNDGVRVVNPDGSAGAVANSGTGQTNIGVAAKVGQVTSVGPVFLRSRSTTGPVTTAATVSLQDGVIHGAIQEQQPVVLPNAGLAVSFPSSQGRPAISLEPDTQQSISPGVYTNVSVKSRAKLSLAAGTYFVDSISLEPQSTVSIDSQGGGVTLYVRNDLTVRGAVVDRLGAAPNVFIGVLGTAGATISAPFQGRVIAPNGPLTLDTVGAPGYTGAFMAKSLTVHQNSTVTCSPF